MAEWISQYWMQVLFGGITTFLSGAGWYIYKQFKALKMGMQAMLRDRIIEQYNKYMDKGYIPIYAMENVTAMYKEYHALGGNGTITQLYEELLELPHRKEDVK
jgi:ribonucleotide monophosphatase NagD (HAD superfamily)